MVWLHYTVQCDNISAFICIDSQSISIPHATGGPGPNPKEYQEDTAYS